MYHLQFLAHFHAPDAHLNRDLAHLCYPYKRPRTANGPMTSPGDAKAGWRLQVVGTVGARRQRLCRPLAAYQSTLADHLEAKSLQECMDVQDLN